MDTGGDKISATHVLTGILNQSLTELTIRESMLFSINVTDKS